MTGIRIRRPHSRFNRAFAETDIESSREESSLRDGGAGSSDDFAGRGPSRCRSREEDASCDRGVLGERGTRGLPEGARSPHSLIGVGALRFPSCRRNMRAASLAGRACRRCCHRAHARDPCMQNHRRTRRGRGPACVSPPRPSPPICGTDRKPAAERAGWSHSPARSSHSRGQHCAFREVRSNRMLDEAIRRLRACGRAHRSGKLDVHGYPSLSPVLPRRSPHSFLPAPGCR